MTACSAFFNLRQARIWQERFAYSLLVISVFSNVIPYQSYAFAQTKQQPAPISVANIDELVKQAQALWRAGNLPAAAELQSQAIDAARQRRPDLDAKLASMLVSQGITVQRMHGAEKALPIFSEAVAVGELAHGPSSPLLSMSLSYLGRAYEGLGRFGEAEALIRRAIAVQHKAYGKNDFNAALFQGSLARVLRAQKRPQEAIDAYAEVVRVTMTYGMPQFAVIFRNLIFGVEVGIESEEDSTIAAAVLDQARAFVNQARTKINDFPNLKADLPLSEAELEIAQARLEIKRRKLEAAAVAALKSVEKLEEVYGANSWDISIGLNILNDVRIRQGFWSEVIKISERKLALYRPNLPETSRDFIGIWRDIAIAHDRNGDLKAAIKAADKAVEIAMAPGNRDNLGVSSRIFLESALLHLTAAKSTAGVDWNHIRSAFEAVQWSKRGEAARAIALAASRATVSSDTASLVRKRGIAIDELAMIERLLAAELGLAEGARSDARILELRSRNAQLTPEINELDRRISEASPQFSELAQLTPTPMNAVARLLEIDEAIVVVRAEAPGLVMAVSRDYVGWGTIQNYTGTLQKAERLRNWLSTDPYYTLAPTKGPSLRDPMPAQLGDAHELFQSIFQGEVLRTVTGKKHLYIVADGVFASVPFHALISTPPSGDGIEAFKNARWLIRDYAISMLPSVSTLKTLRERPSSGFAMMKPFAGFGDPVIGVDNSIKCATDRIPEVGSTLTSPPDRDIGTPARSSVIEARKILAEPKVLRSMSRLPETRCELYAIGKTLGATRADIFLDQAATETRVKQLSESGQLARYRVLSFATHGLIGDDLLVGEAALVLTPPTTATARDDGLLTASEISSLDMSAEWVILSACDTASGARVGSETLTGLARAFFFAGAKSLLVSHWPIDTEVAVKLTTKTFESIQAKPSMRRAEALQRATVTLLDAGNDVISVHPFYWAPMSFVGVN